MMPCEYLNVLLDIPRLWSRKSHDQPEDIITLILALGYCIWLVAFKVAAYSVLFLDGKAYGDKRFKECNGVHTRTKVFSLLLPIDAADARIIRFSVVRCDYSEACFNRAPILMSLKFN